MQRKWKWVMALVLACALILSSVSSALAYPNKMVRVIIGFNRPPVTTEENTVRAHGGFAKHRYHLVPAMVAEVPERAMPRLRAMRGVRYVELDGEVEILDDILPWGVDRIDAEKVWGGSEDATSITPGRNAGAGVKIAIIDTGIDLDHEDLNVVDGITIYGGTTGGDDDHGHGSHVAGTVAALDNDIGVVGVAPQAELYAVKVLNSSGSGYWSTVIAGIEWAVDHGMDIINMSLGSSYGPRSLKQACDNAESAGVVVVAAAGNNYGGSVIYPARYNSVIAVSATDSSDNIAYFSSIGTDVELAAPGATIYSTYKNNSYDTMSGTSMASPHVTGVAALVIASGITDNDEVRLRLQETADDLGSPGRDSTYGYGLVDADEADLPADSPPTVAITSPIDGDTVSDIITISANASDDNDVTQVEFYIDDVFLATDATAPYEASWNTTAKTDGSHDIKATATDSIAQTTSHTIGVTVDNTDNPPTVAITNPTNGDTVSGAAVTITADASDDDDVTQVEFFYDTSSIGVDSNGADGWSIDWNTTTVANGLHNIKATATDSIAQTTSHTIGVTVDNTAPDQVSGLIVTTVSSSQLDLDWDANSEPDLDHYNVYRSITDGGSYSLVDSSGTNSYSDTGLEASTTYYYKVSAVDAIGNEGAQSLQASGTTSEAAADTMHIDSIDMNLYQLYGGRRTYATATVTIVDASDNPVAGATVSGHWEGATSDSDSGTTDVYGQVTPRSNYRRRPPSGTAYTFVVDNVAMNGWTYDAGANIETSDSVSVP